jgi:multiple sugar transport system permease protein
MKTVAAAHIDARRDQSEGISVAARRRRRARLSHIVGTALILGWTLPPFLYLVVLSVKPEGLIAVRSALVFWPTLDRYRDLVITHLGLPIWNSLLTSIAGAFLTLALASLAAVTFSFLDFRGKAALFLLMLLPRMFPPVTTLIPIQLGMKTLGLIDTRTGLILLFAAFQIPLAIWVMRTALAEVPRELVESAALDGASLPVIVTRVVLPLAGPGLLAAFILAFIFNWNEFLFPLILTSFNAKTGSVAINSFTGGYKQLPWGPLAVLGVVMTIPVILFVLAFRAALVRGFTAGAVKG